MSSSIKRYQGRHVRPLGMLSDEMSVMWMNGARTLVIAWWLVLALAAAVVAVLGVMAFDAVVIDGRKLAMPYVSKISLMVTAPVILLVFVIGFVLERIRRQPLGVWKLAGAFLRSSGSFGRLMLSVTVLQLVVRPMVLTEAPGWLASLAASVVMTYLLISTINGRTAVSVVATLVTSGCLVVTAVMSAVAMRFVAPDDGLFIAFVMLATVSSVCDVATAQAEVVVVAARNRVEYRDVKDDSLRVGSAHFKSMASSVLGTVLVGPLLAPGSADVSREFIVTVYGVFFIGLVTYFVSVLGARAMLKFSKEALTRFAAADH